MPIPPHTASLLRRERGRECVGARFHSPTPMLVEETSLALEEWTGYDQPTAWLCATCRDNLHVLLGLLASVQGGLPLEVRREFGNDLRALGISGWRAWEAHQKS